MATNKEFLTKAIEAIGTDDLARYGELRDLVELVAADATVAECLSGMGRTSLAGVCTIMLDHCKSQVVEREDGDAIVAVLNSEAKRWSDEFADVVAAGNIDIASDNASVRKAAVTLSSALAKSIRHMEAIHELAAINATFNELISPTTDDAIEAESVIDDDVDVLIEKDFEAVADTIEESTPSVPKSKPVVPEGAYVPSTDVANALSNLIRACEREIVAPKDESRVFLGTVKHETLNPPTIESEPLFDIDVDDPDAVFVHIEDEIDPALSISFQDALEEERLLQQCAMRELEERPYSYYNEGGYEVTPAPTTYRALESEAIPPYPKDEVEYLGVDVEDGTGDDEVKAEDIYNLPTQTATVSHAPIEPISFEVEEAPKSESDLLDETIMDAMKGGHILTQEDMAKIAESTGCDVSEVTARSLDIKTANAFSQKPDVAKEPY